MRLLRYVAALGLCLAVIGAFAFMRKEPGVTDLPLPRAVNEKVKLKPFPESQPWKPGPESANALTRGEFFLTNPPSPTQLSVTALAGGAAITADRTDPPARIHWLANGQVLIRWGESLHLIDPATGAVTLVTGYDDAVAASPDGAWVIYASKHWSFGWMVNVRTGERFTFPNPPAVVRWIAPDLAVYGYEQEDGYGFLDMAAKTWSWHGNRMLQAVRLRTGEICYATEWGDYVLCHPTREAEPVTLTGYRSAVGPVAGVPVPDPSGTRIAFVDRLGKEPRKLSGLTATAYATKPLPPNPWVDTLVVYDSAAGRVKRYPLPEAAFVQQILWSPDGARIGMRTRPGDTTTAILQNASEFRVLDLATGAWTEQGRLNDANASLERVLAEGLLIRQGAELQELRAGEAPRPWLPGKQFVPELLPETGPYSGIGRDWLFAGDGALQLYTAAGDVISWPLGDAAVAKASVSPDRRWAAVLTADHRLLLLRSEAGLTVEEHALVTDSERGRSAVLPYLVKNPEIMAKREQWRKLPMTDGVALNFTPQEQQRLMHYPVKVGESVVYARANQKWEIEIVRDGKVVYTYSHPKATLMASPTYMVQGLANWDGKWVFETVESTVLVDGESLNERLGYKEIFGFRMIAGKPFFFFTRDDGKVHIAYDGQVAPQVYDQVPHYGCCDSADYNPQGSEQMVTFFGVRDGQWYLVDMGVYQ